MAENETSTSQQDDSTPQRTPASQKKPTPRYTSRPKRGQRQAKDAQQGRQPRQSQGGWRQSGQSQQRSQQQSQRSRPTARQSQQAGQSQAEQAQVQSRQVSAGQARAQSRASEVPRPQELRRKHADSRTIRTALVAVAAIAVVAVVVIAAIVMLFVPAIRSLLGGESEQAATSPAGASVSFVAVGDNLPDDYIGWFADGKAGEMDDGLYDYSPLYKPIATFIQNADLAYIDEETHLGGDDIGPQGYPSFNATDAMAAAVVDAGFDLVASASNHCYDWGQEALEHSVALWESQPVAFTGTSITEEQYNRIPVVERDGITFALLNYTYGVNYDLDLVPEHTINFIDDARITADVTRAHDMADVVLVAMHWGTELLTEADEEQVRVAQLLADLDVDVVLGSHPHVIGPMAWVTSSKNPEHRTLVAYSLGNFVADHESPLPDNVLEGMLTCDFVREEADAPVSIENIRWIPLVFHSNDERTDFAVYMLDNYSADLAAHCRALSVIENPLQWLRDETERIVGPEWF